MLQKSWLGEQHAVIGVQISQDNHLQGYQFLRDTPYATIAVLLNRPAHNLSEMLEKKGMPLQNLFYVDHVSKVIDSPFEHSNAVYSMGKYTLHKTHTLLSQLFSILL